VETEYLKEEQMHGRHHSALAFTPDMARLLAGGLDRLFGQKGCQASLSRWRVDALLAMSGLLGVGALS